MKADGGNLLFLSGMQSACACVHACMRECVRARVCSEGHDESGWWQSAAALRSAERVCMQASRRECASKEEGRP